jgi:3-methylfumaryl-CoA hydratase
MSRLTKLSEVAPKGDDEVPEAARLLIGVTQTRCCLVTARDIRRFAQAIGEPIPPGAKDDELVAPPLFCQTLAYEELPVDLLPPDGSPIELDVPLPAKRVVGGASDFTIHRRLKAGEIVTVTTQLKDVQVKHGKSGVLYLVSVETRCIDANGQPVSTELATYVKRP